MDFQVSGGRKLPRITQYCNQCGACRARCPLDAIRYGALYSIDETRCIGCGRCVNVCRAHAIIWAEGAGGVDDG